MDHIKKRIKEFLSSIEKSEIFTKLSPLKKHIDFKSSGFLSLLFVVAAILWLSIGSLFKSSDAEEAVKTKKITFTVQAENSESRMKDLFVQVRGETEPSRLVTLKAQTTGRIEKVSGIRGGPVDEGFLIAQIAPEDREEKLVEAKALLKQRQLEHKTSQALSKKGFRADTGVFKTETDLKKAETSVATIEQDLGYTKIKAPFKGVLERRFVEIGNFVTAGSDIAVIADLNPIRLSGPVSEQEISLVREGEDAVVKLVTGQELRGKVTYKSSVADDRTHTFRIELDIPNPENQVPAGITADIYIPVKKVEAHFVSPAIISLSDNGTLGIKTVLNGIVTFHPVTLVDTQPDGVWVTGLPQKAQIITSGQEFVVAGEKVKTVLKNDEKETKA